MAIIGFTFTKLHAEKTAPAAGKIGINNNVALTGVSDATLRMAETKKGLKVGFAFETRYEPKIGGILLQGEVLLLEDAKVADAILAEWAKSKSLPKELMTPVLNQVLERSNIQALLLAREMGLPSPVPMPKVNVQMTPKADAKPVEAKKDAKPKKK
jgi:hypothetical protein